MELDKYIINVENFPKEGIVFKDITPLLNDKDAFKYAIDEMTKIVNKLNPDVIIGSEARGFIFACAIAYATNKRFVPVRKKNKLPRETYSQEYFYEYNNECLEIHKDAIKEGDTVVLVDDLLATGGTAKAQIELVKKCKGKILGSVFLIDLVNLHEEDVFDGVNYESILKYN
ncbi:adenine phosphoribosyltransferase [Spiroplasma endosymbiont of Crioceris asparagi]|uniref:adenine phosphoribosyltransferase n=1 Tax=Spiroplasma endosymbiont of Crioceris asparagi TaxID=3066286 RepID=UPI003BAF532C